VLRLKSLIVERPLSDKLIASPKLTDTVVAFAEDAMPLLKFGWKALG
jgi:uncharacterized protein (DUF2461 family)